jgi:hypothetical protein
MEICALWRMTKLCMLQGAKGNWPSDVICTCSPYTAVIAEAFSSSIFGTNHDDHIRFFLLRFMQFSVFLNECRYSSLKWVTATSCIFIQGVSGEIVNILGASSMDCPK